MTTISDEDRAEATAMFEVYFYGYDDLGAPSDSNVRRWLAARDYVLAAHECPTVPVWRPTTADEIQAGWEVRARDVYGEPSGWGTAHERLPGGSWCDPDGNIIGYHGWTYETTAPVAPDVAEAERLAGMLDGRCLADFTHRDEEHRQSFCMLPADHAPLAHDDCMGCTWTDGDHYVAAWKGGPAA